MMADGGAAAPTEAGSGALPPLGRDFAALWAAAATSNLGDGIRVTALPLLAAALTPSPTAVAGVTAASFLPWLLFGPVGGAIVDRSDRRRIAMATNAVRAVALAAFALAVASGRGSLVALYAVALLVGVGEVLVDSAYQSLIPLVVPRARLDAANGRWHAAQMVADEFLGGPVGSLLFVVAPALPFAVDALTFGAGALGLTQVRAAAARTRVASTTGLAADVREGVRWLWRHRLLRTVAVALALTNAGFTAGAALLVLLVTDTLGGSPLAYGLVISAGAVGGLTGSLVAERIARRIGRGTTMGASLIVGAALFLAIAAAGSVEVLAAVWTVVVLAGGVFNVVSRSLRQTIVPDRLMGRVIGAFRLLGYGTIPLGALAGGVVADAFGVRAAFVAGFAVNIAAALLLTRAASDGAVADAVAGPSPDA